MKKTKRGWNSTLRPVSKRRLEVIEHGRAAGKVATGELALFVALYHSQRGRCAVTGEPLLPPGHARFHCQGSHLLPKGSYPKARLWPQNVVMILTGAHDQWGACGNKDDLRDMHAGWGPIVDRYQRLQTFYNTSTRDERENGCGPLDGPEEGSTGGPGIGARPNANGADEADDLPF